MTAESQHGVVPSILVVEDEDSLATLLQYNLEKEGYGVSICADGEEALIRIDESQPDLVVLDWMLPTVSGIEVCRRLRQRTDTRNLPIVMLTARGEESDRIRGLDTGADDYVVKPFSMSELCARVRAVLRRIRPGLAEDRVRHGDIVIDRVAHRVRRAGEDIHLGPTEFRLLDYFMQHPGRVFSREQLLNAVWGSDVYVETRTVDACAARSVAGWNATRSAPSAPPAIRSTFERREPASDHCVTLSAASRAAPASMSLALASASARVVRSRISETSSRTCPSTRRSTHAASSAQSSQRR